MSSTLWQLFDQFPEDYSGECMMCDKPDTVQCFKVMKRRNKCLLLYCSHCGFTELVVANRPHYVFYYGDYERPTSYVDRGKLVWLFDDDTDDWKVLCSRLRCRNRR